MRTYHFEYKEFNQLCRLDQIRTGSGLDAARPNNASTQVPSPNPVSHNSYPMHSPRGSHYAAGPNYLAAQLNIVWPGSAYVFTVTKTHFTTIGRGILTVFIQVFENSPHTKQKCKRLTQSKRTLELAAYNSDMVLLAPNYIHNLITIKS